MVRAEGRRRVRRADVVAFDELGHMAILAVETAHLILTTTPHQTVVAAPCGIVLQLTALKPRMLMWAFERVRISGTSGEVVERLIQLGSVPMAHASRRKTG
jgi:hypothetical protein